MRAIGALHIFFSSRSVDPAVEADLSAETNGNSYGTTENWNFGLLPGGTVFKLTPGGKLTTIYSFCSQTGCTDGSAPGGLVQTADGSFYGTTLDGGTSGFGTVFHMTPGGTLTTLYNFCTLPRCTDGADPIGVIMGTDGNLYGTTAGTHDFGDYPTLFKLTPSGTETALVGFPAHAGAWLSFQDADGDLYGRTSLGGFGAYCNDPEFGCGTLFKVTPAGNLTTLYLFCTQTNCTDGDGPTALVRATDGNLYGQPATAGPMAVGRSSSSPRRHAAHALQLPFGSQRDGPQLVTTTVRSWNG